MNNNTQDPKSTLSQKNAFTKWINSKLHGKSQKVVKDLFTDLSDGTILIELLSILFPNIKAPKYNPAPKMNPQKLDNLAVAFNMIETAKINLAFVKAQNLLEGNANMILGLIWTLIMETDIKANLAQSQNNQSKSNNTRDIFLEWVQKQVKPYGLCPQNFDVDFKDGKVFQGLVHSLRPDLFDWKTVGNNPRENITKAFYNAETHMSIPTILDIQELLDLPKPDEKAVMCYCIQFLHYQRNFSQINLQNQKMEEEKRRLEEERRRMEEEKRRLEEERRRMEELNRQPPPQQNRSIEPLQQPMPNYGLGMPPPQQQPPPNFSLGMPPPQQQPPPNYGLGMPQQQPPPNYGLGMPQQGYPPQNYGYPPQQPMPQYNLGMPQHGYPPQQPYPQQGYPQPYPNQPMGYYPPSHTTVVHTVHMKHKKYKKMMKGKYKY